MGKAEGKGHGTPWLPAPVGEALDREDARQREDGPGSGYPELVAAAVQGALRQSESAGGLQDGGSAERPVQRMSQEPVGDRVRVVSYAFQ